MLVLFFNDGGEKSEHIILDNIINFGVEIPSGMWHTLIALEAGTVVYEIKDGPYSPADDKNFAQWAPQEGDKDCSDYMNHILTCFNLS